MLVLKFVLLIVFSYFFGNISVARFLSRAKNVDITKQGSGNPGTMNMIRTFGAKMGVLTLLLDVLKGAIPALVGYFLGGGAGNPEMAYIMLYSAGLAVIIGHMYPIIYKFQGGKSVACALGVFIVATPLWLALVFLSAILYLYFFDYGAIFSFIVLTIVSCEQLITHSNSIPVSILLAVIYFLILLAHRKNIERLLFGNENKVNLKHSLKKMLKKDKVKETKKEQKNKELS